MLFNEYLDRHLIVQIGIRSPEYVCAEAIVDNPDELISIIEGTAYYISHIRWWDHVKIGVVSPIGYGGTRNPRDYDYYFAETDICKDFDISTTLDEYRDYLAQVKGRYIDYSIYPAFDIKEKKVDKGTVLREPD